MLFLKLKLLLKWLDSYLLARDHDSTDSDLFLLSKRVSQDPLENHFGQQRARGGRNKNFNVQQCLNNEAAIRKQKSCATNPMCGNCSSKQRLLLL